MHTSNRDDHKLENTVKQSRFKHLGELHEEWTEAAVSESRVTTLRYLQEKKPSHFWNRNIVWSILPGLRRKRTGQWSKVLFSDEIKCCISFGNQGPRVWRKRGEEQNPCCLKSSVKFPQSVMIWAAVTSAGVGPLCFLKSTVNAAIYQDILEHVMLPSADKLYGDADFIFQQDLASAHTAKGTKSWFKDHGVPWLVSNLAWPEPQRESMMRDTRPNNADELKAAIKATWASLHLSSAMGW